MFCWPYWIAITSAQARYETAGLRDNLKRLVLSPWTLVLCKLIIFLVSAFDVYLTIKYVDFLPNLELNPLGRWLMDLDRSTECDLKQVAGFITAKFTGNFVALLVIESLTRWKQYVAVGVAGGVAICQLLLLYFLAFYDPGVPGELLR